MSGNNDGDGGCGCLAIILVLLIIMGLCTRVGRLEEKINNLQHNHKTEINYENTKAK